MTLQDAPTLEDFSDDFLTPPPEKINKKKRIRNILLGLALLLMILFSISFAQSNDFAILTGKGNFSGYAVDESGEAIQVEVFVFGEELTTLSDETGYFYIEDVPAGERSIIVAFGDIATEEITTIVAGENTDLGTITVPTETEIDY